LVFQVDKVSVARGQKEILHSLSFGIQPGSLTFITGLNGSGKSTLLQTLSKMLPFSGSISFLDRPLRQWTESELSKQLAIIQQLHTLPFALNVRDFILLGRFSRLGFWGNYQASDYHALDKAAAVTGVMPFLDQMLSELSGGELQKVYITQALIQETEVMLLDEPSRFLDPLNRKELYQLLEQLTQAGKTILCVSHDVEIFSLPNAHFLGIRSGHLVWEGKVSEVQREGFYGEVYGLEDSLRSS
jgi:iron complex transport system ATP-binding protein